MSFPKASEKRVLRLAHEGHLGIMKTKNWLRTKVWSPTIDHEAAQVWKGRHWCQVVGEPERIQQVQPSSGLWKEVAIDVLGSSSSFGRELAYNYWFPQPFLWSSYHVFSHVSDDYRSTNANLYTVWIPIQSYLGQHPSVCVRGSWKSLSYSREPTPKMFTFLASSYNDEVGRQKRRFLKSLKLAEAEKKI